MQERRLRAKEHVCRTLILPTLLVTAAACGIFWASNKLIAAPATSRTESQRAVLDRAPIAAVRAKPDAHGFFRTAEASYHPRRLIIKFREGSPVDATSSAWTRRTRARSRVHQALGAFRGNARHPRLAATPSFVHRMADTLPGTSASTPSQIAALTEAVRDRGFDRTFLVSVSSQADVPALCAHLSKNLASEIVYAEPDLTYTATMEPNDTHYSLLYGMRNIKANLAWDTPPQGSSVIIAVSDTGIDYTHPDLAGNMWENAGEIAGNNVDDDTNGFVDDQYGYDFVTWNDGVTDPDPDDGHGHGTHVAGTAAAVGNNAAGVIGVAWRAKIMAVKGLADNGSGSSADLANTITYAANMGAHVINMSWGGGGFSQALWEALSFAHSQGVVLVAAAGNALTNAVHYPAGYKPVVSVIATDQSDGKAWFSNYGYWTDLAAPGVDILSTIPPGIPIGTVLADGTQSYSYFSGTSMATPHVAGAAALIKALRPSLTNEQIRSVLHFSADNVPAMGGADFTELYAHGRLNVDRALDIASPMTARIMAMTPSATNELDLEISGYASGPTFSSYKLEYAPKTNQSSWTHIRTSTVAVPNGVLATWNIFPVPDGEYLVRLTVQNAAGEKFTDYYEYKVDTTSFDSPLPNEVRRAGDTAVSITGTIKRVPFMIEGAPGVNPTSGWSHSGISEAGGGNTPVTNGTLATWNTAGLVRGDYTLRIRDGAGDTSTQTVVALESYLAQNFPIIVPRPKVNMWPANPSFGNIAGDAKKEILGSLWLDDGPQVYAYYADGTPVPGWPFKPGLAYGMGYASPIVTDTDSDGLNEVIALAGDGLGRVFFILNADGTVKRRFSHPGGGWGMQGFAVADLNRDGLKEIISVTYETLPGGLYKLNIRALDMAGQTLAGWPVPTSQGAVYNIWPLPDVTVAQLDSDSELEFVVPHNEYIASPETYRCRLYAFNGDGTQLPGWPMVFANGTHNWRAAAAMDTDGNGRDELYFSMSGYPDSQRVNRMRINTSSTGSPTIAWDNTQTPYNGHAPVAMGNIDGEFLPEVTVGGLVLNTENGAPLTTNNSFMAILADLNNNGVADLLDHKEDRVPGWSYWWRYLLNGWNAQNQTIAPFPLYAESGTDTAPFVADLDNNGKLDIVYVTGHHNFASNYPFAIHRYELNTTYNPTGSPWPFWGQNTLMTRRVVTGNQAPTLSVQGSRTQPPGTPFNLTVTAADPENNPITFYQPVTTVTGWSYTGTGNTRTFTWTGTTIGSYSATFKVSDPPHDPTHTTQVTVTLNVQVAAPTISGFTPTSGPVGTSVTITGTTLTGATEVKFNTTAATSFSVDSATQITATVPSGATTGKISVTTPGGTAQSAPNFTVTRPPRIDSFTPPSGAPGTVVTIRGANFASNCAGCTTVDFNGASVTSPGVTDTQITATVPAAATTGKIRVTTPEGSAHSAPNFVVLHPPVITSFTPTSGATGTNVTVNGSSFTDTSQVTFNGTSASSFTVLSAGQLTAVVASTTPPGAGPIRVTNADGTGESATNFTVLGPPPEISSFSPTSGPVGTVVTLSGSHFTGTTSVQFNGRTSSFTVDSDAQISATVPTGATTGPIGVTTASGSAQSATNFTVIPPPAISSFSPASGPVGTSVTITGTNFTGATAVAFNGTDASFTVISATQISTSVPTGASTGPIRVTTPGGTTTSSSDFTVTLLLVNNAAFVSQTVPGLIGAGRTFTASLTFLNDGTTTCTTAAGYKLGSQNPQDNTRWGMSRVSLPHSVAPGSQVTFTATFTAPTVSDNYPFEWRMVKEGSPNVWFGDPSVTFWVGVMPAPVISSFAPSSGPVGTEVTIDGSGFWDVTSVKFNGVSASFIVAGTSQIRATVPAGATTGPIRVTTQWGDVTSSASFAVTPPPTITSFSPTSGPVGTSVTITGANFTNANTVAFNGVSASFTVVSSTQITATVPAGATTGPIRVATPAGTATSAANFTVTLPPAITSFSPTSGGIGTSVTITGTSFTGATAVRFNGVAASFSVNSSTQIIAPVPSSATTGPITVTTAAGTATSAANFTVIPPPTITSFSPAAGPVGTVVTVTGTNFTGATAVRFNTTFATAWSVNSSTQITATVPVGATTGRIFVTTPGGTAMSATNFEVAPPPTITSLSPESGAVGALFNIWGTNYANVLEVKLNGTAVTNYTVISSGQIGAFVPAGATTGKVTVRTVGGTATSANDFRVIYLPVILGFNPSGGTAGTTVIITGEKFTGTHTVRFNGADAAFSISSDTQIRATVPAAATDGPILVWNGAGQTTSSSSFDMQPSISSLSPTSGPVGTTVTMDGADFVNVPAVKFNGVNASSYLVLTSTRIRATVATGTTTGPVSVTADGLTASGPTFTVTVPPTNNAQDISQSVPTSLSTNQTATVSVTMKNIGNTTWTNTGGYALKMLYTQWGVASVAVPPGVSVAPNAQYTFSFTITAPSSAGAYNFQARIAQNGIEFGDYTPVIAISVTVSLANNAQFVSQEVPNFMTAGQSYLVSITMRNTGTTTWTAGTWYKLGSQNPQNNLTWGLNRVYLSSTEPIAPNAQKTFVFRVIAPPTAGTYNFQWRMLQELGAATWFGHLTLNLAIRVTSPPSQLSVSSMYPTSGAPGIWVRLSGSGFLSGLKSVTFTHSLTGQIFALDANNPEQVLIYGDGLMHVQVPWYAPRRAYYRVTVVARDGRSASAPGSFYIS